jgi:signal transduction histidine kinase
MITSLRTRLFWNHLAVLLCGMAVVGVLSWLAVQALYEDTLRENLLAEAQVWATTLGGLPLPQASAQPYSQAANLQPGIHTRILSNDAAVIAGLGQAGASGEIQIPPMEANSFVTPAELSARTEIAQALQGNSATAIRRVAGAHGRRVLYAAVPILGEGGSSPGLVYLAMPLPAAGLPPLIVLSLAASALIGIMLATLAASLLARRVAQPVERVERAARAVAAGDLGQSVPLEESMRELASLGRAFNQMTASLRHSEQAKNAFIADVTHELRTPLTVIKGTIETLEDGALEDQEGRGALLGAMQRETDRLIRLVNELLILVRADAGALNLELLPLDLAELARRRCEHLARLASQRGVTLVADSESARGTLCVLGDSDRVAQVIDNLLDNAIRFSPHGASVHVHVRRLDAECACAVEDAGPGIPEAHLAHIFERFYRADASRARQSGGAGLGLAIARALVVAQGGRIAAEARSGGGTTITFFLPAAQECHEPALELTHN